jgi:hypothetical protein
LTRNADLSFVAPQVQVAVDKRTVDAHLLIQIAVGRTLCAVAEHILDAVLWKVSTALNGRIRRFYSTHIFRSLARLDTPTWDDPVVAAQIDAVLPKDSKTVAWAAITAVVQTGSTFLRLFSQTAVLMGVLRGQRDGFLLSLLSFAGEAVTYFNISFEGGIGGGKSFRLTSLESC